MAGLREATLDGKKGVIVAGHRGIKARYPENTLLGMQKALDEHVDMIEFDLRLTRDKVVVLMHDETVDRTTDGTGPVSDYTLEEIKKLDAGIRFSDEFKGLQVPTLKEFCDLISPYPELLLNVEIKDRTYETVDLTMAILKEYGLVDRCVFCCFDANIVAYMHDQYHVLTQGFLGEVMFNFVDGPGGTYEKMYAAGVSMKLLNPEAVRFLRDKGIQVWPYCPDTAEQMEYALECGGTLVTCNEIIPAIEILKERGLRYQPSL